MPNDHSPLDIPIINWFDEPFKQSIKSVFNSVNKSVEAKDIFKKYRRAHFRSLKRSMNKLKILGMNSPINLTDIYYPAHVSTSIYRRLYERDWHRLTDNEEHIPVQKPENHTVVIGAEKYVEEHDRVMVLGGPGTGKTTLLRFLAYAYTDKETFSKSELKTSKFPLFIRLPDLAKSGESVESYASAQLKAKTNKYASDFMRRVFKNGLVILLLDSLDEVPRPSKSEVIDKISKFCDTYPACSLVISCRTADYEEIIEDFYEVELARLTENAVKKIVHSWFKNDKEKAKKLLRHLKNDEAVASLTENPLLLSLLCIQFRHDLILPKRKAELYRRCVDALLRDWDASRGFRRKTAYENLSDDRKERIFEHVAAHFFQYSPRYVFPEKKLIQKIGQYIDRFDISDKKAKGILKEIESHHGILEKVSADSYGFSHPSFQEYFTARCALSRRNDSYIVRNHFENEEWAGVIEFIVALREDPEELLQFILKKSQVGTIKTYPAMARRIMNLWLLYRCLSTGAALKASTYNACYEHIISSQIDMAGIYRKGGVVPFAVLMADGVRHSYYYWKRRPTLYRALQPLRQLANTIFALPSIRYSNLALGKAYEIVDRAGPFFEDTSLALCLVVPLVTIKPMEVQDVLVRLRDRAVEKRNGKFYVTWIDESTSHLSAYMK